MRVLALLAVVLAVCPVSVEGQWGRRGIQVDVVQPLNFGTLIAGVPETVLPTDPIRAARLDLEARNPGRVLAWLLLPNRLRGPGNASIPLEFGPGSAGFSPSGSIGAQSSYDPSQIRFLPLPDDGTASIFLGGTASAPAQAAVGQYTATISLVLVYLGN